MKPKMTLADFEALRGPGSTAVPVPGLLSDVNVVLLDGQRLSNERLLREFVRGLDDLPAYRRLVVYDETRIAGTLCSCEPGLGEFVLRPYGDEAVEEGGKRYMDCRLCGGVAHL